MHPMKRLGVKASDRSIALNFGLKPINQTAPEDGPIYQMTDAGPASMRRVRATSEQPPVRIRIRVFPRSLSHTPFPWSYHEFRRWSPNPSNRKGATMLY